LFAICGVISPIVEVLELSADRRQVAELAVDTDELDVCAEVEPTQPVEAHLADTVRGDLAAGVLGLGLDPIDQRLDVGRRDRALVGGAQQSRCLLYTKPSPPDP
jgi:hypothetical protein